jgi:hypothetical protein
MHWKKLLLAADSSGVVSIEGCVPMKRVVVCSKMFENM